MTLAFNEEQRTLKDTAREFAKNQSPIESFRQLRNGATPEGFSADIWKR
jgi:acyl-CoA dehydrogenase